MKDKKASRKKKIMVTALIVTLIAAAAIAAAGLLLTRGRTLETTAYDGLIARFGWQEVAQNNTLMSGVTIARGEAMGFEQVDALTLRADGSFVLIKDMHTTVVTAIMPEPVSVVFTFRGTYTHTGSTVTLSEAKSAEGDISWGTIANYMDVTEGHFDSSSDPGILSFYPTAFFVERAKNSPMTVHLDPDAGTFRFEAFTPEIERGFGDAFGYGERENDRSAGLMPAPLAEDMSAYSLKDSFAENGLLVGTCINARSIAPPYGELAAAQFSSVTPENALKPQATLSQRRSQETGRLTVEFSGETVELLDWCLAHEMPLRAHTLVWYNGTPDWIFREDFRNDGAYVSREEMLRRMEDYISGFFAALEEGGWSRLVYVVDVVNEAIIAPSELRDLPWRQIIGDDYVWYAFRFARQYAPEHIKLAYNDFDLDAKTDRVIELASSLVDENGARLIDVIGHQGHYGAYSSIDSLSDALARIWRETGCEIQITELDVNVSRAGTLDELKIQGQFYFRFREKVWELRAGGVPVTGLTLWGFADEISWMPENHMHLYDRNLTAKYAYFGLLGIRGLAGFDTDASADVGGFEGEFVLPGDESRRIRLYADGSFVDTVTGSEIRGSYILDGDTITMNPEVGGYISLTLTESGAVRTEAAGGRTELVKK